MSRKVPFMNSCLDQYTSNAAKRNRGFKRMTSKQTPPSFELRLLCHQRCDRTLRTGDRCRLGRSRLGDSSCNVTHGKAGES